MKTAAKVTGRMPRRTFRMLAMTSAILGAFSASLDVRSAMDETSEPPSGDPSAYTAALPETTTWPHEANDGSLKLDDDEHYDKTMPRQENVLQPGTGLTSYNYPTNGRPSPLFGAEPFSQQLILFEEFGPERMDPSVKPGMESFPQPTTGQLPEQDPSSVARSSPKGADLESFIAQPGMWPAPKREANTYDKNPWQAVVENFLGRTLDNPPAEGRPPGEGWAHQRWNEFMPQTYFKTVQAGARTNGGFRDEKQMHGYAKGEFGPGGLYHRTYSYTPKGASDPAIVLEGTTKGIGIQIHPKMPVQTHKSVWTFDGTLPPKLLMARVGQPMLMRHYNALPVDPRANRGFGLHTITTHEHNGHSPAESDGFANAFFFPGQYYDYRWPLQLAGYDSINTTASDPRASFPCSPGETLFVNDASPGYKTCEDGIIKVRGDWRETMSTHWFHDHMLDFTARNVYKGNAVAMNYYSGLDRGREEGAEGKCNYQNPNNVNLCLPSGDALDWGNRDYDINLVIGDKAWDKDGQLWFNPFNTDGFIGDQMLVNWEYKPFLDVRARRYRFRLLNGSVSRYFAIAMVREIQGRGGEFPGPSGSNVSYARVPFHMVANDGNIMEHSVPFDGTMDLNRDGNLKDHHGILPTQSIAERYDIVVDFAKSGIKPGDKIYMVNLFEHATGLGPKNIIPLGDVLSGKYKAEIKQTSDGPRWDRGDPVVGKFLELRVKPYSGVDLSMNPADYEPAKPKTAAGPAKPAGKKMIPLWLDRDNPADQAKLKTAKHREFIFGRSNGTDLNPWTVKTDGGAGLPADPRRISAAPQLATGPTEAGYTGDGTFETWKIVNGGNGWSHPVHVHFEEGIILKRDGKTPPEWEKWARKDVYRVGGEPDSTPNLEIAIQFREFAGTYVEHCHNTQHEDNAMLVRWDIEHPGQFTVMPTPMPTWDGVRYTGSAALPKFRDGYGTGVSYQLP